MEIKINFEKIHFWILLTAIVLIGGWIFVHAQTNTQGHPLSCLYTSTDGTPGNEVVNSGSCGSGYTLMGGGCNAGASGNVKESYPDGGIWHCNVGVCGSCTPLAYNICCKVQE